MFDDINKVIPKLEEKDGKRIYQNISNRNDKKEDKKILNKKLMLKFTSFALILLFFIMVIGRLTSVLIIDRGEQGPQGPNGYGDGVVEHNNSILLSENSVIGIAAFNEFQKEQTKRLSNNVIRYINNDNKLININEDNNENEYLKISYPYDYVKIVSAYKFTINVPSIEDTLAQEIVETSCGLGELEVVVADFETYVDYNGYKRLNIQDTLICLRGYNGYYTILVNSGAYYNSKEMHVFSSHKKLTEDEVNKDFTPPILSIFLKVDNDSRYVYFETSDNLLNFGNYNQNKAFKNLDEIERASKNTLYSVMELTKMPVKEVEVKVIEINLEDKEIKVQSEENLEYVYISENTEGLKIENINVGDIIIVEYDFLFEKYDPSAVLANSITLKNNWE